MAMADMQPGHIVRVLFAGDRRPCATSMTQMGGLVEAQVAAAAAAVVHQDSAAATHAVEQDPAVDALERDVEGQVIRMLALRQPMAQDLRQIVAALEDHRRAGADRRLRRQRGQALDRAGSSSRCRSACPASRNMTRLVQENLKLVVDAVGENDAAKAVQVWRSDQAVDDIYNAIFRELVTYMMEDPRNITPCTHLLFIAKNLERIGDHATNIAETVHYTVTGEQPAGEPAQGRHLVLRRHPCEPISAMAAMEPMSGQAKPLVLVVEDEAALATMLRYNLEKQGFRVDEAGDGQEALVRIAEAPARPGPAGLDAAGDQRASRCAARSAAARAPATCPSSWSRPGRRMATRCGASNTGADDYITKPFNMDALLARMRALLRRSGGVPAKGMLEFHDIAMDLSAHRVQRNGRLIHLGPTEFRLLEFFMQHPRRVFSRGRNCWMPCGGGTSTSSRARSTSTSAACASRSTARRSWTWCAPCAPPATRSIPRRSSRPTVGRCRFPADRVVRFRIGGSGTPYWGPAIRGIRVMQDPVQ